MRTIAGRDPRTGRPIEVTIEDGRISSIRDGDETETAWLSAGLVDLQINGYAGCDLNAEGLTPETVVELTRRVLATGVTTFLATLISAPEKRIVEVLAAIAEARSRDSVAEHMVAGVHMEGPHLSGQDGSRGAHSREFLRPPSLEEFDRWQASSGGLVKMVTVSPHFSEAPPYIAGLRARGVHVSIGHTHCSAEEIRAAAAAGAELSTHLGNGLADPLPRHPNLIWAQLAEDRLTAMLIADGHHLPDDTLTVMLRAKGLERSILVSDAVALAGMPPGRYRAAVGGDVELSADGSLGLAGTRFLAGATKPLKSGVAQVMRVMGTPLWDALRLATANPGRFVGGRGILRVGADADLFRFHIGGSGELDVESTMIQGQEEQSLVG
ncbi:N-acetylglucosamine-6-phosphate deacetylase [Granulicella sibirica]|uniref:N-acetylglucosamine-6-phosphate deacetylase n=1 Tax=Granulicella sibirica TaxID=2479048 RepID=A0A4Q0T2M3_9BACT|nr:amidohydrolase family protein [Granulicella sibirica]RXH57863.1 N-acetylglucosamine-6-phosphate deacetylase [Granulicella sibirica]